MVARVQIPYGVLKRDQWSRQVAAALAKVEGLRPIAERLDCTMAQLALAWCTLSPNVSTVITGASRVEQVVANFETLDVIPKITPEIKAEIEAAVA